MPTNKVNNNIKLKEGGGVINDATEGLSINGSSTIYPAAGETITGETLPVAVYQNSADSEVYACDGNDTAKLNFIGFAVSNSTDGNSIVVKTDGIVGGFTGLTTGSKYYVQDDKTLGTSKGTYEVFVGYAVSATEILIIKENWQLIDLISVANVQGSVNQEVQTTTTVPASAKFIIVQADIYSGDPAPSSYRATYSLMIINGIKNSDIIKNLLVPSFVGLRISLSGTTLTIGSTFYVSNTPTWLTGITVYCFR